MLANYDKYNCPICATQHVLDDKKNSVRCTCGKKLYILPDGFGGKSLVASKEEDNENK